jgi:hypothetical protein
MKTDPTYTVGEVGFGPTLASNPVDNEIIADLRAENAELIRRVNRLTWVLERCIPADNTVANERLRALERAS